MTHVPTVSLDAIRGAVAYVAENWGDYGYSIGIAGGFGGGGTFRVRCSDGSEFAIKVDRYGNASTVEDAEVAR